jgi:hypothetical protein
MSIKTTLGALNKPNLTDSLGWLCHQKMPAKAAWNISRLSRQVGKEIQAARELYIEKLKDFCELTEAGHLKPQVVENEKEAEMYGLKVGDPIPGSYKVKEDASDDFKKWNEEYMDNEVTLESYKIHMDDLGSVELAPQLLNDLEEFIMTQDEALAEIQKENGNVLPLKN